LLKDWCDEKKNTYLLFFDLERQVFCPTYPVRDQNLVVQGKRNHMICLMFFIFLKSFENKNPNGKRKGLFGCFLIFKKKSLNIWKIKKIQLFKKLKNSEFACKFTSPKLIT